jgi:hypothetical protein
MTQAKRIEAQLRRAGARGICAPDFIPPTIDGGGPILRLAARVHELRNRLPIRTVRRGGREWYVLETTGSARVSVALTAPEPPPSDSLFSLPAPNRDESRVAVFDDPEPV